MRYGISTTCLYPQEATQSLARLTNVGFRLFEIFFNTYGEFREDYLNNLKSIPDSSRSVVRSIHSFTSGSESMMFFSSYDSHFADSLDFYHRYSEAASRLGAEVLVLHDQRDYLYSTLSEEEYFEQYTLLFEVGRRCGIQVAQESVGRFRSEDPDFIRRMQEYLEESCCFVFDIKQAVRVGKDPFEMCSAIGNRLVHTHLNGNNGKSDCLLPGGDTMDCVRLMKLLDESGYSGDFIIEVYQKSFPNLDRLLDSRHFVEQLMEQIAENIVNYAKTMP